MTRIFVFSLLVALSAWAGAQEFNVTTHYLFHSWTPRQSGEAEAKRSMQSEFWTLMRAHGGQDPMLFGTDAQFLNQMKSLAKSVQTPEQLGYFKHILFGYDGREDGTSFQMARHAGCEIAAVR